MGDEARGFGLVQVLMVCDEGNIASIRTIEGQDGVLEGVRQTGLGSQRRYLVKA